MTDRKRQRIGRVGGCRFCLQRKDSRHHRGDLRLIGTTVAGDGGLDLAGCVEMDVDVAFGRGERDDTAGLRGPIAVYTFCLANTRSIAMTSGRWVSIQCSTASLMVSSRRCRGSSDGVRTTSTSSAMTCRPVPPSMTDSPQRVNPGSTPITRTGQLLVCEHLFEGA